MKLLTMIFVTVLIMAFTTVAVQAFPVFSSVADADTWNRANFPNNNWGASNVITNGAAGTNRIFFNSFIFWDLPDEVIGEEILSATLTVPLRNVPTGAGNDYALHAYDQSWVEGTGSGSESGDGVTSPLTMARIYGRVALRGADSMIALMMAKAQIATSMSSTSLKRLMLMRTPPLGRLSSTRPTWCNSGRMEI